MRNPLDGFVVGGWRWNQIAKAKPTLEGLSVAEAAALVSHALVRAADWIDATIREEGAGSEVSRRRCCRKRTDSRAIWH